MLVVCRVTHGVASWSATPTGFAQLSLYVVCVPDVTYAAFAPLCREAVFAVTKEILPRLVRAEGTEECGHKVASLFSALGRGAFSAEELCTCGTGEKSTLRVCERCAALHSVGRPLFTGHVLSTEWKPSVVSSGID
jgi:hypothetical protein